MKTHLSAVLLGAAWFSSAAGWVQAQVAGTTISSSPHGEASELAHGWSAKKSIFGKAVYNDNGVKIGKVEDLIIAPDRNVSYVIVGAGGFIGLGRHDVAIPISRIQAQEGRIVMPGATRQSIESMPAFEYTSDAELRTKFIAGAERDITKAKERVAEMQSQALLAAGELKTRLEAQVANVLFQLRAAEGSLADMKQASAGRWRELENHATENLVRLRKALDAPSI